MHGQAVFARLVRGWRRIACVAPMALVLGLGGPLGCASDSDDEGAPDRTLPAADVPTVSVTATLVAREDVPDASVQGVLRGIFDNLDQFRATHHRLRAVNRDDAEGNLTLPMHAGAEAFYADEGDPATGEPRRHVVVSGGQGGVYYPTAGAIARLARQADANLHLDVQTSGGSVSNARLLHDGDADFALIQDDIAAYAREGSNMFAETEPMPTIRGLAALYPEHIQIVARRNAEIESVADLAGKRVAIGDIGSGTEANALQILEAYGLSTDDLGRVERLGASEARDYLQDGRIDAAFFTFAVGTAAIQDLAHQAAITFVPVEGEARERLMAEYPFYHEAVIPRGAYREVEGEEAEEDSGQDEIEEG